MTSRPTKPTKNFFTFELLALLFVLTFIASLGASTILHDPTLHYIPAYFFGWDLDSYSISLITGFTVINIPEALQASALQLWVFFMFPSITLFVFAISISIYFMHRLAYVLSTSIIMLNFASFDFSISNSDANNALLTLTNSGMSETTAYAIHIILYASILISTALFFYIIFENNPKDSTSRLRHIT